MGAAARRCKLGRKRRLATLFLTCFLGLVWPAPAQNQWNVGRFRAVTERSSFRIELGRAGLLKALGDDHVIGVSEYRCDVLFDPANLSASRVELAIPARALQVLDPHLSPEKRVQVQKKMEGPEVLDSARFGEIRFTSQRVSAAGPLRYRVEGELKIRDVAKPVGIEVTLTPEGNGYRARGEARIRQKWFGITPPSAGVGTVKVKDEMRITFDLLLEAHH